nr:hypothetical protein GCM10025732_54930 [Glycomyces mayteni]
MRAIRLPRLHVITDTRASAARAIGAAAPQRDPLDVALKTVAAALAAGARLIQVRPEDHYTDRAAFDFAAAVADLCDAYGAVCLVNDRVHIAQAVGADGVHLGAEDLPLDAARRLLPAAIIGGTCRDPESARAARRAGADYLGVGPVWGTTTKTGLPQPIGLEGLAAVCAAVDLPVIAIGGITAERAALCREAGAHGVAVVGAIAAADDPAAATAELLAAVDETPGGLAGTGAAASAPAARLAAAAETGRRSEASPADTATEFSAAVGEAFGGHSGVVAALSDPVARRAGALGTERRSVDAVQASRPAASPAIAADARRRGTVRPAAADDVALRRASSSPEPDRPLDPLRGTGAG